MPFEGTGTTINGTPSDSYLIVMADGDETRDRGCSWTLGVERMRRSCAIGWECSSICGSL
jgi:hypothetical protein